jgi:cell shape-determining protein MreC
VRSRILVVWRRLSDEERRQLQQIVRWGHGKPGDAVSTSDGGLGVGVGEQR